MRFSKAIGNAVMSRSQFRSFIKDGAFLKYPLVPMEYRVRHHIMYNCHNIKSNQQKQGLPTILQPMQNGDRS